MFGWEWARLIRIKIAELQNKIRTNILRRLFINNSELLLVLLKAEKPAVILLVDRLEEFWQIKETCGIDFRPNYESAANNWQDLLEKIELRQLQYGWEDKTCVICVCNSEVHKFELELPASLAAGEAVSAVYWEIEGELASIGQDINEYWLAFSRQNDKCLAGAISSSNVGKLQNAILSSNVKAEMAVCLQDFDCIKGSKISAEAIGKLYEAQDNVRRNKLALAPSTCNYKLVTGLFLIMLFLAGSAIFSYDLSRYYQLKYRLTATQQQLQELSLDQERLAEITKLTQAIEQKNNQLQILSDKKNPWYSIMVNLGIMTVDGVWLEKVAMHDDKILELHGAAIDYIALAAFIKQFESASQIFPNGPVLISSGQDGKADGMIHFQMRLIL